VIGVRADVDSMNVYTATSAFSQEVADLLYLRLARERDGRDGPPELEPLLAESWKLADDGLTLSVQLAAGARWSDGQAIEADDVVFSHRAAVDPAVGWVGRDTKEFIREVTAQGPRTVVYRFSRRYPSQLVDAFEGNIVPAHALGQIPFEAWPQTSFLDAAITSGPFRLVRFERAALIELARNPHYLGAPLPRLDSVVFRVLPDEEALVSELLSGELDFVENLPEQHRSRVAADGRFELLRVPDLSYTFLCWNTARPLFAEPTVRRALTLAIDRAAIIAALAPETGRAAHGPIPSTLWAHDGGIDPLPYDPRESERLLGAAGWRDTDHDGVLDRDGMEFRFVLETNQESRLRRDVVEAVAAQLAQLGIQVEPRFFEFGSIVERHERHDFDAFVSSWRESTKLDLRSVFHSAAAQDGYNYGSYANAEVDAWIERARAEGDPRAARDAWGQVERRVVADQPYTFLFERDRLHAVRRGLGGVEPDPRSIYAGLEEWHW
jgi:peptide/nickel transport system substrate-binding protein